MALTLSKGTRAAITRRDLSCPVCTARGHLTAAAVIYQIRPGDDPANGVKLCRPCRAAIDRREIGICGTAPDALRITDAYQGGTWLDPDQRRQPPGEQPQEPEDCHDDQEDVDQGGDGGRDPEGGHQLMGDPVAESEDNQPDEQGQEQRHG